MENGELAMSSEQKNDLRKSPPKSQIGLFTVHCLLLIVFCSLFTVHCSSAPPPVTDIYSIRNMAVQQINLANHTANRGLYEDALLIIEEARRLAISADDPSLRIQSSISRGNILFSLGREEHAFQDWEAALAEGDNQGQALLAAQARIFLIRASLILLDKDDEISAGSSTAADFKDELDRLLPALRQDPFTLAAWYITMGLAERQLERWEEAESAVRRALEIYDRNLWLEDSAYSWFLIASIRSLSGNYDSALAALRTSINIDRRAENGYGLANSWQAMGDVYDKAGLGEEARAAWQRAAEIFRAIGLDERAERLEI